MLVPPAAFRPRAPQLHSAKGCGVGFLEFHEVSESEFGPQWSTLLDRDAYQWAPPETYRMIPGIEELERDVGSDATGRLFS
jgi:hypothetical protein